MKPNIGLKWAKDLFQFEVSQSMNTSLTSLVQLIFFY